MLVSADMLTLPGHFVVENVDLIYNFVFKLEEVSNFYFYFCGISSVIWS